MCSFIFCLFTLLLVLYYCISLSKPMCLSISSLFHSRFVLYYCFLIFKANVCVHILILKFTPGFALLQCSVQNKCFCSYIAYFICAFVSHYCNLIFKANVFVHILFIEFTPCFARLCLTFQRGFLFVHVLFL